MDVTIELTESEQAVIRRFVGILGNDGVQAVLALRVINYGNGEATANALSVAIEDLIHCCGYNSGVVATAHRVAASAPSLALVAMFAKSTSSSAPFRFPEDFIPSDELVRKCLDRFFDDARKFASLSAIKD